MTTELENYYRFTGPQRRDKALHTLQGIIEGVVCDQVINPKEIAELYDWLMIHADLADKAPFAEVFAKLHEALRDQVLTTEEGEDLMWLCTSSASSSQYYGMVAHAIQELQGVLHGVLADAVVNEKELHGIQDWVGSHEYLKGVYPYDEIESVIVGILKDGVVTEQECARAKAYFKSFANLQNHARINDGDLTTEDLSFAGICATCPEIEIEGRIFCFTGISAKGKREAFRAAVTKHGGTFTDTVVKDLNYLIIGANGNPCWAFACYGRKIEKAMQMRKSGHPVALVHENDFWDVLA
jgi:hypothetical protein